MPHPILIAALALLIIVSLVLGTKAVLWIGRDAKARGFARPWLFQVVAAMQLPWAFLMYYLVCRAIDARCSTA